MSRLLEKRTKKTTEGYRDYRKDLGDDLGKGWVPWGLCRASKWNHVLGAFLGEGKTKDNGKLAIDSWISVRVVAGRGKCHAHSLLF